MSLRGGTQTGIPDGLVKTGITEPGPGLRKVGASQQALEIIGDFMGLSCRKRLYANAVQGTQMHAFEGTHACTHARIVNCFCGPHLKPAMSEYVLCWVGTHPQ